MSDITNLLSKEKNSKRIMEQGEEFLAKHYNTNQIDGTKIVGLGIDGGSTQTRVTFIPEDGDAEKLKIQYTIPSLHASTESFNRVLPQSDALYDNMDSWIDCITNKENAPFSRTRILRGTKYADAGFPKSLINSSIAKIETPAYYENLIDAICYALIMNQETLYTRYELFVCTSLPPDNILSEESEKKFIDKLKRKFVWENKDLNIKFEIDIKGVIVKTEPEAVVKGFSLSASKELEGNTLLIEVGGSTVGTALLSDNRLHQAACQTFLYGGSKLKTLISNEYMKKKGESRLTAKQLEDALNTGIIKIGRASEDISDIVISCKKKLADSIFADITSLVFDSLTDLNIGIKDISTIVFSGRGVKSGDYTDLSSSDSGKTIKYSIADALTEKFKPSTKNAEFIVLTENLIPFYNAIEAFTEFGEYLFETDDNENENITSESLETIEE